MKAAVIRGKASENDVAQAAAAVLAKCSKNGLLIVGEGCCNEGKASEVDPAQRQGAQLLLGPAVPAQLLEEFLGGQQPRVLLNVCAWHSPRAERCVASCYNTTQLSPLDGLGEFTQSNTGGVEHRPRTAAGACLLSGIGTGQTALLTCDMTRPSCQPGD